MLTDDRTKIKVRTKNDRKAFATVNRTGNAQNRRTKRRLHF